ncbi:GNAT family N-acetyltransferase [Pseudonocardia spinosispora]|uniref:GNAT family N-acetyltransferase n=1 Tax=Pseudonocardia spinosispora TaxID=103441 RepID=UPI001FE02050|nr:GNAT family N-acetyltransferase [Pseudonocardia spinosispora]
MHPPATEISIRQPIEADYPRIQAALRDWWPDQLGGTGATERALLVPRLFLQHFTEGSLFAEQGDEVRGFLIGFLSATKIDEGYIHFVGVNPAARGTGLARELYGRFFEYCRAAGRTSVRAVTSPGNDVSYAFHTALGFAAEPGEREFDGRPVQPDYDGPGLDRVSFVKVLN